MRRIVLALLLIGATVVTGCEITFFGPDDTKPQIQSVSVSPSDPEVGERITINVSVYEPDSFYELSYDTDDDGRFDDSRTVTYYTTGSKTIRVRAKSAGGTDEVAYSFFVVGSTSNDPLLYLLNDTGNGVSVTIYDGAGFVIRDIDYLAPGSEAIFDLAGQTSYRVYAENQWAIYGPEWVYIGTTDTFVDVSDLN